KYYANDTWVAVLEGNGFINFYNLETQITGNSQIPDDSCNRPQACASYFICRNGNMCRCPLGLAQVNCNPKVESLCDKSKDLSSLVILAKNLSYFALGLISPDSKTDLDGCKSLCLNNCTCLAMFFDNMSGNCYLFSEIGNFVYAKNGTSIESYVKVTRAQSDAAQVQEKKKQSTQVVIVVVTVIGGINNS
ncbi:G-type lectin S-receptor-like serine/threonine-protein kinase SD2-5, partial [Tanacetum coccineum]